MNSFGKTFLTIFLLGLISAICFEARLEALAAFFGISAFCGLMLFPILQEMFD